MKHILALKLKSINLLELSNSINVNLSYRDFGTINKHFYPTNFDDKEKIYANFITIKSGLF